VKRLRVALLHGFAEEELFGMEAYAARVTAALSNRCQAIAVRPRPASLPWRSPLTTWWVKSWLYPRQVRRLDADLYHVLDHSHADLLDALPADATVITCHDLFPLAHGPAWRRRMFRRRVAKLKRAARVIAVSEATAAATKAALGVADDRLVVVRNRLDRFFLAPPSAAETEAVVEDCGLPDTPFALHVGAVHAYKNVEGMLRGLKAARVSVPLVKVGARLTRRQRRLAAKLGITVHEIGRRSQGQLRALYHRAALLLSPSWDEGYGWPVAEAMACGLPAIVSRTPALVELTAGAAVEVDPADPRAIGESITVLLGDPAGWAALAERGRRRAAELAEGDLGDELIAVYEAVAEGRRVRCAS